MAITTSLPSHITSDEIRTRIAELETTTEEDNPFDPWWSVDALESELRKREAQEEEDAQGTAEMVFLMQWLYNDDPYYTFPSNDQENN